MRGCPQYRVEMRGVSPPHGTWVAICGTDVVRTNAGFIVLEDNLRVPSGVSYMIANRKAVKSSLRRLYRRCRVREVEHYGNLLLQTLRERAPPNRPDPCIALLTPGVGNAAFYEHMFLAHELGAELVEGRDLLTRNGFVYMRTTEGLRQVDVIYHVPTRICRRPENLEYTLDNLDRLIVKRVGEAGGYGMLVGPQATAAEREAYAADMRANPADFISQAVLSLSRAPCLVDGAASSPATWICGPSCCGAGRRASCRAPSAASHSAGAASW